MFEEKKYLEKGFDEAELQCIMEEIESLEREFRGDGASDFFGEMPKMSGDFGEQNAQLCHFKVDFKLDGQRGCIEVEEGKSVSVRFEELCLNVKEGKCQVVLDNGIHFNLPLRSRKGETSKF